MKRRKALSLLLSLAIVLSLVVPVTSAFAADGDPNEGETKTSGLSINKTARYDADNDAYTITLEAYATGEKTTTTVTTETPTDIILVLDQSGSMAQDFTTVTEDSWLSYGKQQNSVNYGLRMGNYWGEENLYYKLPNGGYVGVYVRQDYSTKDYVEWTNADNSDCYSSPDPLYVRTDDGYKQVTVKRSGRIGNRVYTYSYTLNGQSVSETSNGRTGEPPFPIYRYQDVPTYTYYYVSNGAEVTIGRSTGDKTVFEVEFYKFVAQGTAISRLDSLKNAVTNFARTVANKSAGSDGILGTDDDVAHRIAVVGYASQGSQWTNTELFIGAEQHNYAVDASSYYNQAFQNMNTPEGQANIQASIGALDADGATYTNYGMEMANGILDANKLADGEKRNRVIVLFTDGFPGDNSTSFNKTAAEAAIGYAKTAKDAGTTVYAVGIFSGANAQDAGNVNGSTLEERANWFMQQISNNNGTPKSPSYYLSAADAGALNSIFKQISDNIQTGGSSTTLTDSTVIRDIVAEAFTMPENTTDVKVYTEDSDGSVNSWTNRQELKLADGSSPVSIDAVNRIVSVTGFNYKDNWCGNETINGQQTFHNGKKLIIEFTVQQKAGFLGGNDVFTNDGAGIYENAESKDPLMEFNKPTVNVPIKDIAVTAEDKNVYLLGGVTLDDLKNGATVTVGAKADGTGEITLDLSKANDAEKPYGLEPWQTAYVTITAKIKDENGNEITTGDLSSLVNDRKYTVEVTVAPKTPNPTSTEGEKAETKTGKNEPAANINVFKPVLTYKDSEAYYGDNAPTDYIGNLVSTEWKHGEMVADENAMGAAPALDISYTPDESKLKDGKYTKQDVPVAATVKIGTENVNEHTTFVHQDCTTACGWEAPATPGAPAFLIHIQTCTLTITKAGNVANEPFVFTVNKDDVKYTEVTIVGADSVTIAELPVGTYSITEDTGWSWRYKDPAYTNNGVELSASNPTGTITCTNTKGNDQWLNDYAVKSNTYQTGTAATDGND